jgi:hypothetical protein
MNPTFALTQPEIQSEYQEKALVSSLKGMASGLFGVLTAQGKGQIATAGAGTRCGAFSDSRCL